MASVAELIMAAQARQKPGLGSMLAQLINAGSTGYSEGIGLSKTKAETDASRLKIVSELIAAQNEQAAQEKAKQDQMRAELQATLGVKAEQDLRNRLAGVEGPMQQPTPTGKVEKLFTTNEKGNIKSEVKIIPFKSSEPPPGYRTSSNGNLEFIPGGPADPSVKTTTKPPQGFRWTSDGNLEPIPGGPTDIKAQQQLEKENVAIASQKEKANLIIGKIDEALGQVNSLSAGVGSYLKNIPSSQAMNLSGTLDTINSLLGFEQLGEMKNQTRTGASGLGQLSDREMQLLISARSSLKQQQSPDVLAKRLNEVKTHFSNWLDMQNGRNPYDANSIPKSPSTDTGNQPIINSPPETPTQRKARLIKELKGAK
jgi:hypothetical protein